MVMSSPFSRSWRAWRTRACSFGTPRRRGSRGSACCRRSGNSLSGNYDAIVPRTRPCVDWRRGVLTLLRPRPRCGRRPVGRRSSSRSWISSWTRSGTCSPGWKRQDQAEDFLRLAAALGWFWLHCSYRSEGRRWLDSAIAHGIEAGIRTRLSWPAHSTAPGFWPSPRVTMTGRAR